MNYNMANRKKIAKRSWVWGHFDIISPNKARCLLCSREMGYKMSSSLHNHLRVKHAGAAAKSSAPPSDNNQGNVNTGPSFGVKPCVLAVEGAAKISDMTCEEAPEICIVKTRELLLKAQLLMCDIEELLDCCRSAGPFNQRREIQQECQANIEEDGETLIIEGFRFESAVSREDWLLEEEDARTTLE
ncbi:hypothetical protein FQN60_016936 [Etheostoma spectabile]|uniref:BED-type domain-containing protein n=1 Tax=Etheostoma spectabile TaxID=54343 RepID=A0A5J5DE26_9PERO|nr:hypothetical protein FQN60_016936 [Etheostoma spectabile]